MLQQVVLQRQCWHLLFVECIGISVVAFVDYYYTVCIGYKVTGCKNIAVITMEFQKITIKTCFSIVKISGKTISAIAIYRV